MNPYFENAKEFNLFSHPKPGVLLIIAPHQDDESLGCGGTIALARNAGLEVKVIFMTDGSQSHPGSKKYPHDKLISLREEEAKAALALLGVKADDIHFMRLPDGSLPFSPDIGFKIASKQVADLLARIKPRTIYLPWRRDPHKDHRATWEITMMATQIATLKPTFFEYFIWLFERAAPEDMPQKNEGDLYYVDITKTVEIKKSAILAHNSQTTDLIDDDENGFTLSSSMLKHFDYPKEYFIQTTL